MGDKYEKQNYSNVAVECGSSKIFLISIILYLVQNVLTLGRSIFNEIVELINRNGNGLASFFENIAHAAIMGLIAIYIGFLLYGLYKRFKGRAQDENRINRIFILTVIQSAVAFLAILKLMTADAEGAGEWIAVIIFAFIMLAIMIVYALSIKKTVKHLQSVMNGEPEGKPSVIITIILLIYSLSILIFPFSSSMRDIVLSTSVTNIIDAVLETVTLIVSWASSLLWLIILTRFKKKLKAVEKKYKKKYI
ncbi:MAG: hypothetical protein IJB49_06070 [Clostridia bacterium]|nr:hypothetical protein [Clostridia bacterium]